MESRPSLQHKAFHPAKRSLAYTGNPGLTLDKSPDPRIAFAQSGPTSLIALSRLCNQSVTPAVLMLQRNSKVERIAVMTNVGFWVFLSAALVSASVICGVAFLELTYQIGRRRSRQHAPISLSRAQAAGTAGEASLRPPKRVDGFREKVRGKRAAEVKIVHASAQVASLKAPQANGDTQTPLQFCR